MKIKGIIAALMLSTASVELMAPTAHATIASPQVSTTAVGNSATTVFTYPFIIPFQADGSTPAVVVSTTTGGVTTIISPSLYSIVGVGNPAGGSVTYPLVGSPITSATTITITRNLAYIQPTAVPNTTFYPHTVEQVADNLDMQIQQIAALGGGGGGAGVSSLNGLSGGLTIAAGSGISVGAAGSTITVTNTGGGGGGVTSLNAQTGVVNVTAGSGISVSASGGNVQVSSTGAATQTVTTVANVTALRALTSVTVPVVVMQNYTSAAGGGGGTLYYNAADTTTADNGCTIFVDAMSHRWYRQYAGPINVRWCGALGNGSTDDKLALQAALATLLPVYIPASPTCYLTSGSLTLNSNQALEGDSQYTSCIKATTAATPIIIMATHNDATNMNVVVRNLLLDRSVTATAGGDGIFLTSYVNDALFDQLVVIDQWNGISVHSTDSSNINNSFVYNNFANGILLASSSWYPAIQWSMKDVFSTSNEGDGFKATSTSGAGSTPMGTWTNLRTYSNAGYGVELVGVTSSDPLQGTRIIGGFFGQDGNDEIHADTYNTGPGALVIQPTFVELAGTSTTGRGGGHSISHAGAGIYLSVNVGPANVSCGVCNQNSYDGLTSFASELLVSGGRYTNNGLGSVSGRHNGINIAGGNSRGTTIVGVTAGNTAGSTQLYGIASSVDFVSVSGGNLLNNTTLPGTGLGTTNSIIAGVLPVAFNTGSGGGSFCAISGCTFTGPVNMGGQNITNVADIASTTSHATTAAITNLNVIGSAAVSGGVTALDVAATRSLGVGTGASGVSGRIDGGNVFFTSMTSSGNVAGTTAVFSGTTSATAFTTGGAITAATMTASGDITSAGTFHVTGASAMHATTFVSGGVAITTGGLNVDNISVSKSMGIGTVASGSTGQLDVTGNANVAIIGGNLTVNNTVMNVP